MNVAAVAGVALASAVLCAMLRRYHKEYAMLVSIAAGIFIMLQVLAAAVPALQTISGLLSKASIDSEYAKILFKSVGICFLAQFSSDACRDAGETALASRVEMAARLAVVAVSLPLFQKIAELTCSLMGA